MSSRRRSRPQGDAAAAGAGQHAATGAASGNGGGGHRDPPARAASSRRSAAGTAPPATAGRPGCARPRRRARASASSRWGVVDLERDRPPSTARWCTPGSRPGRRVASVTAVTWCGSGAAARPACRTRPCRPLRMIVTRSQSFSTSARMWLDSSTVARRPRLPDALGGTPPPSAGPGRRWARPAEQLGVRGERRDQRDLLPVALGVGAALLGAGRARTARAARPCAAGSSPPRRRPSRSIDLSAGQVGPQVHVAGHVGEPSVQATASRHGSPPSSRTAGVGAQQPEQHADRGGLARAVRAEEAVHLARARR